VNRAFLFLPLAGAIAFAGYLGLQSGRLPSETEIINRYAATYLEVAPNGGEPNDCAASPHPDPAVRMVINCVHPSGFATTFFVGPRGEALPEPIGPEA
jgi:hypothetical protein